MNQDYIPTTPEEDEAFARLETIHTVTGARYTPMDTSPQASLIQETSLIQAVKALTFEINRLVELIKKVDTM